MKNNFDIELLGEWNDPVLKVDDFTVCREVVEACDSLIGVAPALGRKPIHIQQAPDGIPRACLNGLPNIYLVHLTCLYSRFYAQIAFQLGHELGHFYINPNRGNWLIESVCTSLSFLCLSELGEKWSTTPPFPHWRDYAPNFASYRVKTVADATLRVGLPEGASISQWINMSSGEVLRIGKWSRDHEMIVAEVIAGIAARHPQSLSAITLLGEASCADETTDFEKWRILAGPSCAPFVNDLVCTLFPDKGRD